MAFNKIQIKRGLSSNVNSLPLLPGEMAFTTDKGKLYVGKDGTTNKALINPDLGTAAQKDTGVGEGDIPILGADGKLPTSVFPTNTGKDGDVVTVGPDGKIPIGEIPTGTKPGQVPVVNPNGKIDGTILPDNVVTTAPNGKIPTEKIDTGIGADQIPILGSDGKLPSSIIPITAITEVFVVKSESEMLKLEAHPGDVAVRTDTGDSYILSKTPATELSNWVEISQKATVPVTSVNSKIGDVVLTGADIKATGYQMASSRANISPLDTINTALGKLEYEVLNIDCGTF